MTRRLVAEKFGRARHPETQQVQYNIGVYMDRIRSNFSGDALITVIVRTPDDVERDFVMTNDTLVEISTLIDRHKGTI